MRQSLVLIFSVASLWGCSKTKLNPGPSSGAQPDINQPKTGSGSSTAKDESGEKVDQVTQDAPSGPETFNIDRATQAKDSVYISFKALEGAPESIKLGVLGLTKALNSLSMNPEIVKLRPVGKSQVFYQFKLSEFGMTVSDIELTRRIVGANRSYGVQEGHPLIEGDWLTYALTRPEVYDRILRLPNNINDLERELGVDPSKAIYIMVRKSGVTFAPRVIERIPIDLKGKPGAYFWRSYDFGRDDVQKRGFQNPETLRNVNVSDLVAGEHFFALPNGLQAYMLTGFGNQHRIDAPSFVASDLGRPQDGLRRCIDGVRNCGFVINGESCISCHSLGIKMPAEIDGYKNVSRDQAAEWLRVDQKRFVTALEEMGVKDASVEPVKGTIEIYLRRTGLRDQRRQGPEVNILPGGGVLSKMRAFFNLAQ